jgi:UDP-N-acetylmuramoyl-tripeptide--D-alanyl-D-alanine ligase
LTIAKWIDGTCKGADTIIQGIAVDSRNVQKGNLYIPIIGDNNNGHVFVGEAIKNGACAVLWQEDQADMPSGVLVISVGDTTLALQQLAAAYRQTLTAKVVGITGSNGKTTTKDMLTSVLKTKFRVHATYKNHNNHIGLPLTILEADESVEWIVLEMGMNHPGEIKLLSEIAKPDYAIITNIGESHLLHLKTKENIAQAKLEILYGMGPNGVLIYNEDEKLLRGNPILKGMSTVGFSELMAFVVGSDLSGTYFIYQGMTPNVYSSFSFKIPMLGEHHVMNALAVIQMASFVSVRPEEVQIGFNQMQASPMRMELSKTAKEVVIINDAYNASPTSMRAAIETLVSLDAGVRKIAILADMLELGEDEQRLHEEIGENLSDKIDLVFCFGSRSKWIAEGAKKALDKKKISWFVDKGDLIQILKSILEEGDIVLFKGSRSMKLEQIIDQL